LFTANVKTTWTLNEIYCTETHEIVYITDEKNSCKLLKSVVSADKLIHRLTTLMLKCFALAWLLHCGLLKVYCCCGGQVTIIGRVKSYHS